MTPIYVAAQNGHLETLKLILEVVNIIRQCSILVRHYVANNIQATKEVDQKNSNGSEDTALMGASLFGQTGCVTFLLQKGASVSAVEKEGFTALHCVGSKYSQLF